LIHPNIIEEPLFECLHSKCDSPEFLDKLFGKGEPGEFTFPGNMGWLLKKRLSVSPGDPVAQG
jgi:hypothetical protein